MDFAIAVLTAVMALLGLVGIFVSLVQRNSASNRIIRLLSWPTIKPANEIALPLSAMIFFCGSALFLLSSSTAPLWFSAVLVVLGVGSSIALQLRRSDA